MSLIAVGLHHRTVPVDLLERVAINGDMLPKALDDLVRRDHISGAVILSTCNRTEVYAHASRFHPGVGAITEFLADLARVDPALLEPHLVTYFDDGAVAHLFTVAAGVDSLVVGESEILGQVRTAWQVAEDTGTTDPALSRVFRHAVEVGKRARTETAIGRHHASVSSVAVQLAEHHLGSLHDRRVLLLGAGEVGEGLVQSLAKTGVEHIAIANRTHARAVSLAEQIGGTAVTVEALDDALVDIDVLLTSTGAEHMVVTRSDIESVMEQRSSRPLLVVDVAVPRDVDPGVAEIPNVTLLDIDDLRQVANEGQRARANEIEAVQRVVIDELERHRLERAGRHVAPLVRALRDRGEELREAELERHRARLARLDPEARALVEAITDGLVNKLLHEPTIRLKESASTTRGDLLADALAELFDLPDTPS
ncbi:MAG: glutamyl-tRNA reductase [Acidimicrobiia bacterium]